MKNIAVKGLERGCSQLVMGSSLFRPAKQAAVFEVIDTYVANGGNTVDTSWVYGVGEAERVVGAWFKAHDRKDMMIIGKACHHYVDDTGAHHPEQKRVRPEFITADLLRSLRNMQVDYFDIFLLHRDDPAVPVGELFDTLEEHKRAGLIKVYGVSNWCPRRIDEAIDYAKRQGYGGVALNSPSLSLAKANESRWEGVVYADGEDIRWHEKTQLPLFSWAPQASGFFCFANRLKPEDFPNPDIARIYYNDANLERMKRLLALAEKRGNGVEPTNLALAYVLNQSFPTCAVIGPQSPAEVLSSLRAADLALSEGERRWLDLQE